MHRYVSFLGLFMIMLTGTVACGASSTTAQTPESAAEQLVLQQTPAGASHGFMAVQTRLYDNFAVVLYNRTNQDTPQELFYQLVHRSNNTWYTKECCDGGGGSLTSTAELKLLLNFNIASSADPRFIFGRTVSAEVTMVEATFADQQTIRVPVKDGLFMVISKTSRNICSIRGLGTNNRVLGQSQLAMGEGCNGQ